MQRRVKVEGKLTIIMAICDVELHGAYISESLFYHDLCERETMNITYKYITITINIYRYKLHINNDLLMANYSDAHKNKENLGD